MLSRIMDSMYYEALSSLLFFSLKALVVGISIIISIIVPFIIIKKMSGPEGKSEKILKIENLKSQYKQYIQQFKQKTMDKKSFKKYLKNLSKNKEEDQEKPSLFVLSFKGDVKATQVKNLREEISLILEMAKPKDEVAILLESYGGYVSHYGLAAVQLQRFRNSNTPLTVCVDNVAGSGGYMMACVGNQILSSPFALIGSIGVLSGRPNVHDFLKKHDINYEEFTAGKYKRTVTAFGKVTDEKRQRLQEQLELVHDQFKNFVRQYRDIDLDKTATGEAWLAEEALKRGLVDKLQCSDDYILEKIKTHSVYKISLQSPKSFLEKMISKRSASEKALNNFLPKDFII